MFWLFEHLCFFHVRNVDERCNICSFYQSERQELNAKSKHIKNFQKSRSYYKVDKIEGVSLAYYFSQFLLTIYCAWSSFWNETGLIHAYK